MAWPRAVQMDLAAQAKSLKNITDNMPSVRSLSKVAFSGLTAVQSVLGYMQSPVDRRDSFGASATCNSPQLSCQNTTAQSDLCCFNSPGGALLLTQFWDTDPVVGPADSWTIHGTDLCRKIENLADTAQVSGRTTAMAPTRQTATTDVPTPTLLRY